MNSFRPKLWTGVGAAVLLTAGVGLDGCKQPDAGKATLAATAAPSGAPVAAAAGEGGEGGSEGGGEAGAQAAFNNIPNDSKPALRLAQLKSFFLVALKQPDGAEAASIVVSGGLEESLDANPAAYKPLGLNEALIRKAAKTGQTADLKAAIAEIEAAQTRAGGDPVAVTRGLVDLASGLYQGAVQPKYAPDPVDYQHSLAAALAAQELIATVAAKDPRAKAAQPEIDKLVAMWPSTTAPDHPTPAGQVLAQASRIELELS